MAETVLDIQSASNHECREVSLHLFAEALGGVVSEVQGGHFGPEGPDMHAQFDLRAIGTSSAFAVLVESSTSSGFEDNADDTNRPARSSTARSCRKASPGSHSLWSWYGVFNDCTSIYTSPASRTEHRS